MELQQQENSAVAIQKTVRGKIHRKKAGELKEKKKVEAMFASAGEDENLAATRFSRFSEPSATRIE